MSEGLKISSTFLLASALVETEASNAMGCCMSCHLS